MPLLEMVRRDTAARAAAGADDDDGSEDSYFRPDSASENPGLSALAARLALDDRDDRDDDDYLALLPRRASAPPSLAQPAATAAPARSPATRTATGAAPAADPAGDGVAPRPSAAIRLRAQVRASAQPEPTRAIAGVLTTFAARAATLQSRATASAASATADANAATAPRASVNPVATIRRLQATAAQRSPPTRFEAPPTGLTRSVSGAGLAAARLIAAGTPAAAAPQ